MSQQIDQIKAYIKEDLDELKSALFIDKYALDDMLLEHPSSFQIIAEEVTTANAYKDYMDKYVKEIYAETYLKIKEEALVTGTKMTEEAVKQLVFLDPRYSQVKNLFLKIQHKAANVSTLKEAMSTRGFMLRDLASLYIAGYFAKDSVSGEASDEVKISLARQKIKRKPLHNRNM